MATRKDDKTIALVAHGGISARQWRLESVIPRELKPDEVLVRIVASGICQADLHFGDGDAERINSSSIWYPRVLGHEGSGYVEKIGSSVKDLEVSDPVILSFNSCGTCSNCLEGEAGYCDSFKQCNFVGEQGVYQMEHEPEVQIGASFFGQSSFASRAIVKERCVVNVARFKLSYEKLCLLAPLGCGIQTGSGALVNTAAVRAGQSVAVIGVGGVGQSAIMAAALRRCKIIIAIDRSSPRLEVARSLGATHTINTSDTAINLVEEVRSITSHRGVDVSLDTSGIATLARQSWDFVRSHGKVVQVGLAKPHDEWQIPMADHMNSGKHIMGCIQGDAIPKEYIPQMIEWHNEGLFPVEKIVSLYPRELYQQAIDDMRDGSAIKPVLLWSAKGLADL